MKEKLLLEAQPDWARALTFAADDKTIAVGRMDGTLGFYDAATGKKLTALGAKIAAPDASAVTAKAN